MPQVKLSSLTMEVDYKAVPPELGVLYNFNYRMFKDGMVPAQKIHRYFRFDPVKYKDLCPTEDLCKLQRMYVKHINTRGYTEDKVFHNRIILYVYPVPVEPSLVFNIEDSALFSKFCEKWVHELNNKPEEAITKVQHTTIVIQDGKLVAFDDGCSGKWLHKGHVLLVAEMLCRCMAGGNAGFKKNKGYKNQFYDLGTSQALDLERMVRETDILTWKDDMTTNKPEVSINIVTLLRLLVLDRIPNNALHLISPVKHFEFNQKTQKITLYTASSNCSVSTKCSAVSNQELNDELRLRHGEEGIRLGTSSEFITDNQRMADPVLLQYLGVTNAQQLLLNVIRDIEDDKEDDSTLLIVNQKLEAIGSDIRIRGVLLISQLEEQYKSFIDEKVAYWIISEL